MQNSEQLKVLRRECALGVLELHKKANAGHIGSSLSCLEILIDLCFARASLEDIIILSKGHAASALYTVFAKCGRIEESELSTFYQDGSRLAAHPPCSRSFKAIPFGTGSLGHGLSLAAGIAFAQKFKEDKIQVYCILSDGDCNEGATWEAALFAAQQGLSNLTVIIDTNEIQGFGRASEVCNLDPLDEKWKSFGFHTTAVSDGNCFVEIAEGYRRLSDRQNGNSKPKCIVAKTVKGHGVSYMENTVDWHYLPMSEEQYESARRETIEKAGKPNA